MRVGIMLAVLLSFVWSVAAETPVKMGGCKKRADGTYAVCVV